MTLEAFRREFINPFARAYKSLGFGPDVKTFSSPRGHFALDHALPQPFIKTPQDFPIISPILASRTIWHPVADTGANKDVTWLDLVGISGNYIFRIAHLDPREMKDAAAQKIFPQGIPEHPDRAYGHLLYRGQPIGPAGAQGLSVAAPGQSARHMHSVLLLRPGVFDDVLRERWGEWWNSNEIKAWCAKWPGLKASLDRNGWTMANMHVAYRVDPYVGDEWYAVDWFDLIFGKGE